MPEPETQTTNYYSLLGLNPTVSVQEIRRAYRDLSKLYHPDTTQLPATIATQKFQQLNEAYATLSNPQRRIAYDQKIGYSRLYVTQAPADLNVPVSEARKYRSSNAYLDPIERPLSAGELFALFILGLTFIACLVLVVTIGVTQGEMAWRLPTDFVIQQTGQAPVEIDRPLESPASLEDSSLLWKEFSPAVLAPPLGGEKIQDLPSVIDQSTLSEQTESEQTDRSN